MNTLASFLETGYGILVLWMMLAFHAAPAVPLGLGDGYWHTHASQILDAANRPVRIAGINWYGFETAKGIPGGLDVQDYKAVLDTVKKNGYNTVRLPLSNQMLESPIIPTEIKFSNHAGAINSDLKSLNSLQILDRLIAYAGSQGLKIILDNHRSEAGDGPEMTGLWFTQGYPESAWIADWQMLAQRYANDPTVIGFDLRNEPHNASSGGACWSCGGTNDWHLAAQRAGNAILRVNAHLLIFVEGVDSYENDFYWWGGNLEGVRSAPVKLAVPNQLVYSAHDYGPVESAQPWFTPNMSAAILSDVWTKHWAYISQDGIAPVWLGEFGVDTSSAENPTPAESMEALWFQSMVQFLNQNPRLSWAYWTLNGDDHNGLLDANYDATPKSAARQDALASIQFPLAIGGLQRTSIPAPDIAHDNAESTTFRSPKFQGKPAQCHIAYTNLKDWQRGFTGEIAIDNTGKEAIEGWKLTWTFAGNQEIDQLWGGILTQEGQSVTVSNVAGNATISPGGEPAGIGFNASYTGSNPAPTKFYLNGRPCD